MPTVQGPDTGPAPVHHQNGVNGKPDVQTTPLSDMSSFTKWGAETPKVAPSNPYPRTFISERSIDEARPLKLIYIGAGVSGITGAIEFKKRLPNLDLVIYEKNPEVGGTWFENRYPGCACGKMHPWPTLESIR